MKEVITLDDVTIELKPHVSESGSVGFTQRLPENSDVVPVQQNTELGESLKELNKDDIDGYSRMSEIDMRTRLHFSEISAVLSMDTLVALKVLPTSVLSFTRQKKRLNVSLMGQGRQEIVSLVSGKREMDQKIASGGFGEKLKGFFGMGGQNQS